MTTKTNMRSYEYNAVCDSCGFVFKNTELKQRWDGFMVCKDDWETRNIADFYQTPIDTHVLPWSRPDGSNNELTWTLIGIGFTLSGGPQTYPTNYSVDPTNRIIHVQAQFVWTAPGIISSVGATTMNLPSGYTPIGNTPCVCTSNGKLIMSGTIQPDNLMHFPNPMPPTTTNVIFSGNYGY